MAFFCNPVNVNYRYQFLRDPRTGAVSINREAADPSLILYQGRYYLFASMTLGVWVSDDLVHWENHRLPDSLPLYDYAPDARVIHGAVVLCASRREGICQFYRTRDILNGPYEEIPGSFAFWDPNLFQDEDGRVYLYWGCSSEEPIRGVELDPVSFTPLGEPRSLIAGNPFVRGFERTGEDHSLAPLSEPEIQAAVREFLTRQGADPDQVPPPVQELVRGLVSHKPYIEGAWMTRHGGRYYLQYACPGSEFNTYGDGVFESDSPLGPFVPARNNPFSYHPGGFMPGAGHGSTLQDANGRWWHAATMRISVHHPFERRVGLWPAGFDKDGVLFCNQRYGDWPIRTGGSDPWAAPEWMLLSYGKAVSASSCTPGHTPDLCTDEDARTWWQAARNSWEEWLVLDLGQCFTVHAVQINFADDALNIPVPGDFHPGDSPRFIDDAPLATRWRLEGSTDGVNYTLLADKTDADTDLSHDLLVWEAGVSVRYLRLSAMELPYGQAPCVSGLRVFGRGDGEPPASPVYTAARAGDLDFTVSMHAEGAVGYTVLWGIAPDKLYHSCTVFGETRRIGALVAGQPYFVRVDAFNENGITEGRTLVEL